MPHVIKRIGSETYPGRAGAQGAQGAQGPQGASGGAASAPLTATWFVDGSFGAATPDGSIAAPYPSMQAAFDAAVTAGVTQLTLLLVAPDGTPLVRQPAGDAIALRIVGLGPYLPGIGAGVVINCGNAGPITLLENLDIFQLLSEDNSVTLRRCVIEDALTVTGGGNILCEDECIIVGGASVSSTLSTIRYKSTTFQAPQNQTADAFQFDSQSERSFFTGGSGQLNPTGDGIIGTFEQDYPSFADIATDGDLVNTGEARSRIIYPTLVLTGAHSLTLQVGTNVPRKGFIIDVYAQANTLSVIDQTSAATIYTTTGPVRLQAAFDSTTSIWSILSRLNL